MPQTTKYRKNDIASAFPKYAFNAKELDEETGMYYYEARYYAPPVFVSRDPIIYPKIQTNSIRKKRVLLL